MGMKRMISRKNRPKYRPFARPDYHSLPLFGLLSLAYLLGCGLGAHFGVRSRLSSQVVSILTERSGAFGSDFLAVFGSYGVYGVLFLLLSTTYLGFLFVPAVFWLKGFCTGALFLVYLQSGEPNAYLLAGISLCLPAIFVLPALLMLGLICIRLSFQLLCRMRGAPVTEGADRNDRMLAMSFALLLAAAFVETYVVPFLIGRAAP